MRKRQQGLATVEFAVIGALMPLLLLAVIEFGRLLFVWNSATEATRRGARIAVVCPVNDPAIENVTMFNHRSTSGDSALLSGLSTANVGVRYLDVNGATLNCTGCDCNQDITNTCGDPPYASIQYVQVRITNYVHTLLLPVSVTLNMPEFETTLPRESLGIVPGVVGIQCGFPT